jgi:hypothetical protein
MNPSEAMRDKSHHIWLTLSAFLTVTSIIGCSQKAAEQIPAKSAEKADESRVQKGTNGEVIITLDAKTQELMGLRTESLAAAELKPEAKAYGRVLDTSGLASMVADLTAAKAASEASQAELNRLKTLAAQNNASERAVQAAQAAATRDQAQAEAAKQRLVGAWGSAIASREGLPDFVKTLSSLEAALVQVSLPAGESLKAPPASAQLITLAETNPPVAATLLGPAPTVDPQSQGQGFLLLVSPNSTRLSPGAAVTAFLTLPGESQSGVVVPRDAVVRFNGSRWVYAQVADEKFERVELSLERPMSNGWFVSKDLKPAQKVVTVGAQELISEEIKGGE